MSVAGSYQEYASIADLYDHVVPYRDRPDINFYVEAAKDVGGPVLEVGCGTGRVLIPTARAGIEIVGLDFSPHMLAICRERLESESMVVQSRVHLVQADMRDFSLSQAFHLATIPFRPFQHLLTVADQLSVSRKHSPSPGRQGFIDSGCFQSITRRSREPAAWDGIR